MIDWPEEISRFMRRTVPVFIHLAAAKPGAAPFVCRGYGFRLEPKAGVLWTYILKSQWLRLTDYSEPPGELSALLTSGVDNESYQFKGRFADLRPLAREDVLALEEQRRRVELHIPNLVPLIHVLPSDCVSAGFRVKAVYSQTPGPGAGLPVMERSGE
ncbi:hypothetical protein [Paenibacillus hamazuiensis]|uniref:hypothetical protein n=1 Tax=Paenibacillus hamazuiensis TaxID=2936508 RepID=UPI00201069F9|nr:hypothetical protein [Paenibacillus hamazuiensis]